MMHNFISGHKKNAFTCKEASRDSNFELLRIIAILFITFHHLLINGINLCGYNDEFCLNVDSSIAVFANSLIVGGVNIFLLISGWYGIKSIKKGIVRLVVDCFVYGLFVCILYACIAEHTLSISDIYNSVKFTNGWYVPNYMYLLLLSPIIESSLKNVSLRNLRMWIFLIIICQIYFGYILGFVDKSGYSAANFVFLYYIGRYMRLELGEQGNKNRHYKFISLTVWVASGAILGIVFLVFAKLGHPIKSIRWWSYNNPFVLIGSISIFVFFTYVKIQKVWINYFATSVLGIYLVLSNSLITDYRNSFACNVFNLGSYPLLFTYAVLLVLLIGFVILVINKIRQPLLNVVYRILKRKNWL